MNPDESGLPMNAEGDQRLAAALYRGLLLALPASARSWFGRLSYNRSLQSTIEASIGLKMHCCCL